MYSPIPSLMPFTQQTKRKHSTSGAPPCKHQCISPSLLPPSPSQLPCFPVVLFPSFLRHRYSMPIDPFTCQSPSHSRTSPALNGGMSSTKDTVAGLLFPAGPNEIPTLVPVSFLPGRHRMRVLDVDPAPHIQRSDIQQQTSINLSHLLAVVTQFPLHSGMDLETHYGLFFSEPVNHASKTMPLDD
jgi:hypothetical protein